MAKNDNDIVPLGNYDSAGAAQLDLNVLEEAGIRAAVDSNVWPSVLGVSSAIGSIRLLVFRRDYEKARELLGL